VPESRWTVGALLIAFVALIALANGILGTVGGWFGADDLTFEKLLGWAVSPLAWLLGVPGARRPGRVLDRAEDGGQ
jgi:nucleoside permease NupC